MKNSRQCTKPELPEGPAKRKEESHQKKNREQNRASKSMHELNEEA